MNTTDTKITVAQSSARVNSMKIMHLSVKRDDDGLRISIQSPIDWKILKQDNRKFNLGGIPCFIPRHETVEGVQSGFSQNSHYEVAPGIPNLSMILADNIRGGVTFVFPPMPISDEKLNRWAQQFRDDIKILYLTYVKPVDFSVIITSQTIERESHD